MNRRRLRIAATVSFAAAGVVLAAAVASLWYAVAAWNTVAIYSGAVIYALERSPSSTWAEVFDLRNYPWNMRLMLALGVPPDGPRTDVVVVPLWPAVPLLLLLGAALRYRGTRPAPGHCPRCDYDLTGNTSGRCPECGAAAKPPRASACAARPDDRAGPHG